jgi:mRNA-degrading endonuclease RelE of RelBE toxin-antitoxin system
MSYLIDLLPRAAEDLQRLAVPQRRFIVETIHSTLSRHPLDQSEPTARGYPCSRALETVQRTDDGEYRFIVEFAIDELQRLVVIGRVACYEQDPGTNVYG